MSISGAEQLPAEGPAIVAANHKSFLDAFFLGLATRRHVRFMAKTELFRGPLRWLFTRLGAFPVRRGESDAEALATARAVLEQGGLLIVFPEGTRVDEPDGFDGPHGADRPHRLARRAGRVRAPQRDARPHRRRPGRARPRRSRRRKSRLDRLLRR